MMPMPPDMPCTTPDVVTVVVAGVLLLQLPPVVASWSVVVLPMQILSGPVMLAGSGLTLTVLFTVQPTPIE